MIHYKLKELKINLEIKLVFFFLQILELSERLREAKLSTDDVETMNDEINQGMNDLKFQIQELGRCM